MKRQLSFAAFILLLTLATGGYVYAWNATANLIRDQVRIFFDDMADAGIAVQGEFPSVTGFPGPHRVRFSGVVSQGNTVLNLPELEVRGIFLPGHKISIELPQGAALGGDANATIWSVNSMELKGKIPVQLPGAWTAEDLAVWQQAGGTIEIDHLNVTKDTLRIEGNGSLTLDPALQPTGNANVRVAGAIEFLDWLIAQNLVKEKNSGIIRFVLTGLSKVDKETGEQYMETALTLQNRTLYAGPLKLFGLPVIVWASRNPPAPPQ